MSAVVAARGAGALLLDVNIVSPLRAREGLPHLFGDLVLVIVLDGLEALGALRLRELC